MFSLNQMEPTNGQKFSKSPIAEKTKGSEKKSSFNSPKNELQAIAM